MLLSFALPSGSARSFSWVGMARRRRPTCVIQTKGFSLTTKRTNFHEWGAASPEFLLIGLIRGHFIAVAVRLVLPSHFPPPFPWRATLYPCPSLRRNRAIIPFARVAFARGL